MQEQEGNYRANMGAKDGEIKHLQVQYIFNGFLWGGGVVIN